jgi:Resolvase, N terminal domain/Recombinase
VLKQITDAGVRVFFYLEDRERTLDDPMQKMMLSLTNFAAEMERERARQRTYDAMVRKAKAGQVTGGVVCGYTNREVLGPIGVDGTRKRQYVTREINEEEAPVVRHVFEMCAAGMGLTRIAKVLNDDGIRPPGADRMGGRRRASARCSIVIYTEAELSGTRARRHTEAEPRSKWRVPPASGWSLMYPRCESSLNPCGPSSRRRLPSGGRLSGAAPPDRWPWSICPIS